MSKRELFLNGSIELLRKDNTLWYIKREEDKEIKGVIPINSLDNIYVCGYVILNSEVLKLISKYGIGVHIFDFYDNYISSFYSEKENKSPSLFLKQLEVYKDEDKRLFLAQKTIDGATKNILKNLKYSFNLKSELFNVNYNKIVDFKDNIYKQKTIPSLMAIEGNIRKLYYENIDLFLKDKTLNDFLIEKRIYHPPSNRINSLISFGNMLLYSTLLNEIYKTRLSPFISFLHELQENRYSLVLDISEIFKPIFIDRMIIRMITLKMITKKDFKNVNGIYLLKDNSRKKLLQEYTDLLDKTIKVNSLNREVSYKHLLRLEAYKYVKYITEEQDFSTFTVYK